MNELRGTVTHITFHNEENGYTVAQVKEKGQKEPISVVGTMLGVQVGETVLCKGQWVKNKRYGLQFKIEQYEVERPATLNGIERYLSSGLIRGLGPSFARKIVRKFGLETFDIIDHQPERLLEIPNFGEKRLEQVKHSWETQRSIREVMLFLQKYGVSPTFAQRIFKTYGMRSIQKVEENPYRLADDIVGVGFKKADEIARQMGLDLDSPVRIDAGITYALTELANEGHTCYPVDAFLEAAARLLSVKPPQINAQLSHLAADNRIVIDSLEIDDTPTSFVWAKALYSYEQGIVEELHRLKQFPMGILIRHPEKAIQTAMTRFDLQLAEQQHEAVLQSLEEKVHIITGGPGTGKSTITQVILNICSAHSNEITLAAPTGRAAKRLQEITKLNASTIHSLLSFDFAIGGFAHHRKNPLKTDLLIVDEASMMDTMLFHALLRALPEHAKLILVGDVDQLPSVGPGNILSDLIRSEQVPVTRLTEIFRQAAGSKITINAHRINQGVFPDIQIEAESDFFFIPEQNPEKITTLLAELVEKRLPKKYNLNNLEDIQVLSPMKKGPIGTHQLNQILQKALNPPHDKKASFTRTQLAFRVGDKVMQIKNNYKKNVFNGDTGFISSIDLKEKHLLIRFEERFVNYTFGELNEIVHAYAVSVHKYQGSECPCIVMPVHEQHYRMLYKNLLYTGLTRGKKLVVLIGTKKALNIAIRNTKARSRYTGLAHFLEQEAALSFPPIQIVPPIDKEA